jgi:hypothetical protein
MFLESLFKLFKAILISGSIRLLRSPSGLVCCTTSYYDSEFPLGTRSPSPISSSTALMEKNVYSLSCPDSLVYAKKDEMSQHEVKYYVSEAG